MLRFDPLDAAWPCQDNRDRNENPLVAGPPPGVIAHAWIEMIASKVASMHLIAIGRLREGPDSALFARYNARLRPPMTVAEIPEASGPPAEVKRREGAALLAAVPANAFVIALDQGGEMPDSQRFSVLIERWLTSARRLCFLIGGAEGLDASVLARANATLSLGPMTWPHFMVRAMLAEQVYRARSIAAGHPYHRAGRP